MHGGTLLDISAGTLRTRHNITRNACCSDAYLVNMRSDQSDEFGSDVEWGDEATPMAFSLMAFSARSWWFSRRGTMSSGRRR